MAVFNLGLKYKNYDNCPQQYQAMAIHLFVYFSIEKDTACKKLEN